MKCHHYNLPTNQLSVVKLKGKLKGGKIEKGEKETRANMNRIC